MSTAHSLLRTALRGALCAALLFVLVSPASAIPAFARKYSLRCTACHEAWPVLNDFGRSFRDNGYQLRLGKDDTVTADPGYWPVAVRVVPNYTYTRVTNQETDSGPRTLGSGGIADSGIDLLMAGTLTKNISFLVVPTGFASNGTVTLESYWAYFSRVVKNSDWLNIRIGQFEVDLPASGHRPHDVGMEARLDRGRLMHVPLELLGPVASRDEDDELVQPRRQHGSVAHVVAHRRGA